MNGIRIGFSINSPNGMLRKRSKHNIKIQNTSFHHFFQVVCTFRAMSSWFEKGVSSINPDIFTGQKSGAKRKKNKQYMDVDRRHMRAIALMYENDPLVRASMKMVCNTVETADVSVETSGTAEAKTGFKTYVKNVYSRLSKDIVRYMYMYGFVAFIFKKDPDDPNILIPKVLHPDKYIPKIRIVADEDIAYVAWNEDTGKEDKSVLVVHNEDPEILNGRISSPLSVLLDDYLTSNKLREAQIVTATMERQHMVMCERVPQTNKEETDYTAEADEDGKMLANNNAEVSTNEHLKLFDKVMDKQKEKLRNKGMIPPELVLIPDQYKIANMARSHANIPAKEMDERRMQMVPTMIGVPHQLLFGSAGNTYSSSVVAAYRFYNQTLSQQRNLLEIVYQKVHLRMYPLDGPFIAQFKVQYEVQIPGIIDPEELKFAYENNLLQPWKFGELFFETGHIPTKYLNPELKNKNSRFEFLRKLAEAQTVQVENEEGEAGEEEGGSKKRKAADTDTGAKDSSAKTDSTPMSEISTSKPAVGKEKAAKKSKKETEKSIKKADKSMRPGKS